MADTVRYLLEESVPELEDLESKGYFSRAEIKLIVQKRQDFEYLLKRRAALKQDYYRYIDYEAKLEELRLIRKHKLGIKGQKSLAEVAIPRRIHFIYERAARKFKSDLDLWLRWIALCKKLKSTKRLSKVVTKALQRHATTAILWVEAACWEFEHNSNVAAARTLMQQGIRMCKGDESIWVEYYRLELLYVAKLRARREVLGLDAADEEVPIDASEPSAAAVKAVLSGAVAHVVYKNAVGAIPNSLSFRVRFLHVLRQFRFEGVEKLREQVLASVGSDFAQNPEAVDVLAREHLHRPLPGPAQGASAEDDAAATVGPSSQQDLSFDDVGHAAACSMYQQGLDGIPPSAQGRLYELYCAYLGEVLGGLLAATAASAAEPSEPEPEPSGRRKREQPTPQAKRGKAAQQQQQQQGGLQQRLLQASVKVAAQLFETLQQAHSAGMAAAGMYLAWIDWAERVNQPKMALKAARKACERLPHSASVWQRRLQLELSVQQSQQHSQDLFATLAQALQSTQPAEAVGLWLTAVAALPATSRDFSSLCDLLEATCMREAAKMAKGGMGHVAAAVVQKTRDDVGLEAARNLYQRLLCIPGAGGDLYRCVLQLEHDEEAAAASIPTADLAGPSAVSLAAARGTGGIGGRNQQRQRLTALYDAAVLAYGGTEVDLWLGYARWLASCGHGTGPVCWRAAKELQDPSDFVAQFRQLQRHD